MSECDWIVIAAGSRGTLIGDAGAVEPNTNLPDCDLGAFLRSLATAPRRAALVHDKACVVAVPITTTADERLAACQTLFDAGRASAVYFISEPVAVAVAVGESAVRVLDAGASGCRCSFVSRGQTDKFYASSKTDAALFASKVFGKLRSSSHGTPVVVCGGGATPAVAAAVDAVLATVEDAGDNAASKVLCLPQPAAAALVFHGASLFGTMGIERLALTRDEYDEEGPHGILTRFPV
jgi:hypothetical protein